MRNCKKTELICLLCRSVMATLYDKFIFPKVFDFCPECQKVMCASFARQIDGDKKLLPKRTV